MKLPLSATDVQAFFAQHRSVRAYQAFAMPQEHLDTLYFAAQRAPTDATAQLYSFVRLVDPELRQKVADMSKNAHLASASESFIICADVYRVARVLQQRDLEMGEWPATAVHFSIGDAVMAAENMLLAAEMLGYQGCWVGGILSCVRELTECLALPEGVFPFAALTIGLPAETPAARPRVPRYLVMHENSYQLPSIADIEAAIESMAPMVQRGDWSRILRHYFAQGGQMEQRDPELQQLLAQQGFHHVNSFDAMYQAAEQLGYSEVIVRRRGEQIEAWVDQGHIAHRGEGATPSEAVKAAIVEAGRNSTTEVE